MVKLEICKELSANSYPGRGIIIGKSEDGKYAVSVYWTMGRSAGSRNRVFVVEGENDEVLPIDVYDYGDCYCLDIPIALLLNGKDLFEDKDRDYKRKKQSDALMKILRNISGYSKKAETKEQFRLCNILLARTKKLTFSSFRILQTARRKRCSKGCSR